MKLKQSYSQLIDFLEKEIENMLEKIRRLEQENVELRRKLQQYEEGEQK